MAGTRPDRSSASAVDAYRPPARLRIPAAIAITLLGGSAVVAASFAGCDENLPEPTDAGRILYERDAGLATDSGDSQDARPDAPVG